jgi:hypothetical protein
MVHAGVMQRRSTHALGRAAGARRTGWLPGALGLGLLAGLAACRTASGPISPCHQPGAWPHAEASRRYPFTVHYRAASERAMARRVVAQLETAWHLQVEVLGFRPPPPDVVGGRPLCGRDARFDVFVWRGHQTAEVDEIAEQPATPHEDRLVYMAVDPWGRYGGPRLPQLLFHELVHACQAADDWFDATIAYEMTAAFVTELYSGRPDEPYDDFQAHPDWSLDRDDGWQTYFMYGAAMYLHFLHRQYFAGDPRFAAAMWRRARHPAGAANEPDYQDALEALLRGRAGIGFLDTVPAFARWRWLVSRGQIADVPAALRALPPVALAGRIGGPGGRITIAPMLLGTSYVRVQGRPGARWSFASVPAAPAPAARWVVQLLPGSGAAGALVRAQGGRFVLDRAGERVLAFTAMPAGSTDPDSRSDARYPLQLTFRAGDAAAQVLPDRPAEPPARLSRQPAPWPP